MTGLFPNEITLPLVKISEEFNVSEGIVAALFLAACASLVPSGSRLRIDDDHVVPPILWVGLVGSSGSGKTPIINHAITPLVELEHAARDRYRQALGDYQDSLDQWRSAPRAHRGLKPKVPVREHFVLRQYETEVVTWVLSRQQERGLLVFLGSYTDFLGYLKRSWRRHFYWSSFYDGRTFMDLDSKKSFFALEHPSPSIIHEIYPSFLKRLLVKGDTEKTLLQNFSLLWLPNRKMPRITQEEIDYSAISALFTRLLGQQSIEFSLSAEALEAWNAWDDFVERTLIPSEPSVGIAAIYPKVKDRAARIALILAAIHGTPVVDKNLMQHAINFGYWLLCENLKVYRELGFADNSEAARITRFIERF